MSISVTTRRMSAPVLTSRRNTQGACLLLLVCTFACLLIGCSGSGDRMRQQLQQLQARNQSDSLMTDDSLATALCTWFDSHGTPNERMLAHYLMGRTWADKGEAPQALEEYHTAAECADTTAADCDFHTLGCICSQTAEILHGQLLISYEITARRQAYRFGLMAGDTLASLSDLKFIAGAYMLMNKRDSAEMMLNEVIGMYQRYGYSQEALQTSVMQMRLLLDQPSRLPDLKALLDRYETESCLFDKHHELPASKRKYYYYKGGYYEGIGQLDSAEYYYRKIYRPDMSFTARDPMYRGLLSVFKRRHQADSIAKYAQLYCEVNDSSIALKDQQLTALMTASHNYNRYQRLSQVEAEKAYYANLRFVVLAVLLIIFITLSLLYISRNRKKRQRQMALYRSSIAERTQLIDELHSLKSKNYDAVIAQKEAQITELSQVIANHENIYHQVVAKDRMKDFENSEIVALFTSKKTFRKGDAPLSNTDWKALVDEFGKDLPSVYATMQSSGTRLSSLQLHVCILLLLDYEEGVIAALLEVVPQTVNTAKRRANQKLFNKDDSASLKANLKGLAAS